MKPEPMDAKLLKWAIWASDEIPSEKPKSRWEYDLNKLCAFGVRLAGEEMQPENSLSRRAI